MNENNFTEEDVEKLREFLNEVAQRATLQLTTQQLINYFKLLSHMEKQIIPKMKAHITEIKRVVEPNQEASQKETQDQNDSQEE